MYILLQLDVLFICIDLSLPSKAIFNPTKSKKSIHLSNRYCSFSFVLACNTISSAYASPGTGLSPFCKSYPLFVSFSISISGSGNNMKSIGKSGHPCLTLLLILISSDSPYGRITLHVVPLHMFCIISLKCLLKLYFSSTSSSA